ncbi:MULTISPECIES: toxin [unclassified Streptomyces]|uniref:toxin n=1 Tax=unclassified Streptomyces TaxID=2593676 RepID=UPI00093B5401|nr:toxin [Streptomyces sp. TSRI0107]OKJ90715.1 toxin [Streptomyces sp. TSRI0107]
MRTNREMRRLADALVEPIRVPVPADPEAVFQAVVESAMRWRGRKIVVHREVFPPHTASGLWLEGEKHDDVVVDKRAAVWHQIVIFCHEVWHMHQRQTADRQDGHRAAAARTDFTLADEQEADRFGMLMGRRLRALLEASADSVYADRGDDTQDLAGRIGAALNYRGTRR